MNDPAIGMIVFAIFIFINFILYGFGEALKKVNETEITRRAEDGSAAAKSILKILNKPRKFIRTVHVSTILMCVTIGYYQVQQYVFKVQVILADKFALYLRDAFIDFLTYLAVALYLIMLMVSIGIIIPKRLGAKFSLPWSLVLVSPVKVLMVVLTPFTAFVDFFAGLILRIFGIDPDEASDNVTEEEIVSIVNEGHEQGILEASEAEMINNIIELDEKNACDVMTHRKNLIAIDGDLTLKEAVDFILDENISRFPVYEDNVDNIIGIVHIRDAMEAYNKDNKGEEKLKDIDGLVRKAEFIPETKNINALFKEMQKTKVHMKVVIDEYGQTAGVVTLEDILEEIVGNIFDEYDEEENNIVKEADNTYIIKGCTTLEELEDELSLEFDEEDYDTLNGYLIAKLDRIPEENDKPIINIENNTYEVLNIENKMISTVRLTINEIEDDGEEDSKDE